MSPICCQLMTALLAPWPLWATWAASSVNRCSHNLCFKTQSPSVLASSIFRFSPHFLCMWCSSSTQRLVLYFTTYSQSMYHMENLSQIPGLIFMYLSDGLCSDVLFYAPYVFIHHIIIPCWCVFHMFLHHIHANADFCSGITTGSVINVYLIWIVWFVYLAYIV